MKASANTIERINIHGLPYSQASRNLVVAEIFKLRQAQGTPEIPHLDRMGYERAIRAYNKEFGNYLSALNAGQLPKTNLKGKTTMAKTAAKKDDKKQTTIPKATAAKPEAEKKPEAPKVVEVNDRIVLMALAQVAGWEPNDPFIGSSPEDKVTVETDDGETELSAMTDDQCKMELGENIGILTPEDQKTVEAMENGKAIWAKFVSIREDLAKVKVETVKKETKAAVKAADKAKGTSDKPKGNAGGIKKAGGEGSPGVIGSIQEFVTAAGKKGITKDGILGKLIARFPDRDKAAMGKTIQAQLPNRMAKEKGIKIEAKKDGDNTLFIIG